MKKYSDSRFVSYSSLLSCDPIKETRTLQVVVWVMLHNYFEWSNCLEDWRRYSAIPVTGKALVLCCFCSANLYAVAGKMKHLASNVAVLPVDTSGIFACQIISGADTFLCRWFLLVDDFARRWFRSSSNAHHLMISLIIRSSSFRNHRRAGIIDHSCIQKRNICAWYHMLHIHRRFVANGLNDAHLYFLFLILYLNTRYYCSPIK